MEDQHQPPPAQEDFIQGLLGVIEDDLPFGLFILGPGQATRWANHYAKSLLGPHPDFISWIQTLIDSRGDPLFPSGFHPLDSNASGMLTATLTTPTPDKTHHLNLAFKACGPDSAYTLVTAFPLYQGGAEIQKLAHQKIMAEMSDRAKSVFLTMMGHEIQTPINVILGFSQTLMDRLKSGPNRELAEGIYTSAQNVLDLFSDLVQASMIETRINQNHLEVFSLRRFLQEEIIPYFRQHAIHKKLTFAFVDDESVEDEIAADPENLKQILFNLLSNALKFTEAGGISLSLSKGTMPANGEEAICIDILDTGIGVREALQEKIFRPFYRDTPDTGTQEPGTGIGLAIALRLANLMKAEIGVESTPGEGSNFTLYLPSLAKTS